MSKHVLSLEAPDTLNCQIIRVVDTSVYNDDFAVECPILEVTVPGFNYTIQFGEDQINTGFSLNLTACNLDMQTEGCDSEDFKNLPDGIYILKYSISPNDQVYAEYNHLRVSKLLNNYNKILCEIDVEACEPTKDIQHKLDRLLQAKQMIDAAKAKVEVCHEPAKGMQLYQYAKDLLAKFDCKTCL